MLQKKELKKLPDDGALNISTPSNGNANGLPLPTPDSHHHHHPPLGQWRRRPHRRVLSSHSPKFILLVVRCPPPVRPMARPALIAWDAVLSFMWVWASALVKLLVYGALGLAHRPEGEALKIALSVGYMFFFAWLEAATGGGCYNPLNVLYQAFSGNIDAFLFTAFGRIPAQVIGSVLGVRLIMEVFPSIGHGPRLSIEMHQGALTEGVLTFFIVIVSQTLKKKDPKSFFMKTWISSISKMTLHILGSDLTGGIMNPASAFGWAYARGDHITLEHLLVYWIAPVQATLLAMWAVRLLTEPKSKTKIAEDDKVKSE